MSNYLRYIAGIENESGKKIKSITARFTVGDVIGKVKITDIMVQEFGKIAGYSIHTREMLKDHDTKHYNVLVRGEKVGIVINNNGEVTTGLDFKMRAKDGTTGAFGLQNMNVTPKYEGAEVIEETLKGTRHFQYMENLNALDAVDIKSFEYKVLLNNVAINNYRGSFLMIPSGVGVYTASMSNRDIGNFLFIVKEMDAGGKI